MIPVRTCPRRWPHASRPCTVSPPAYAWRVLSVEELSALPAAALASQLAEAYQVIGELTAQVGRLSAQVEQLERQARRNSSTSSRPPSSDSPYKKGRDRSLRERGKRQPGKQPGEPGATMKLVDDPGERSGTRRQCAAGAGRAWTTSRC